MSSYRFTLEKGSKKFVCPDCNKKRFVKYIDKETGKYLPDQYGKCDREINCGHHLNPYKDGYAKAIWEQEHGYKTDWKPQRPKPKKKPLNKPKRAFIPVEVFNLTRAGYEQNTFIQNLLTQVAFPFEVQDLEKVISLYNLGTVLETGATTFPFIDINNNVRAVQEKIFNRNNHTDKSKNYHTSWLHSRFTYTEYKDKLLPEWLEAYNKNDTKVSCLFGEHLLPKYPNNPIALVEAPKTAIYGTLYFGFPEQPMNLLWLAVYNLSSLNLNKCKALKGRDVYLFPDLSKDGKAFELWSNKATQIQRQLKETYFKVSDLLEQLAPEQDKEQGKDIADYLIKQDWRLFRKIDKQTIKEENVQVNIPFTERENPKLEQQKPSKVCEKSENCEGKIKKFLNPKEDENAIVNETPLNWKTEINELEKFFSTIVLPDGPVRLNKCSIITDCNKFVNSQLIVCKSNMNNRTYFPYLNSLIQFKQILMIENPEMHV